VPLQDDEELHRLLLELVRSIGRLHVVDDGDGVLTSPSEVFALHELDHRDGLAQQDLADALGLDKSTVSRLVASLEGRGLVVRERDPENRRFVRLALTADGRRLHREVGHSLHSRQSEVLGRMTAAERQALSTGLAGLLRALHRSG
jgi:MarR family transcriptional regulator, lower aerobic nicotinate degradation pathway regulator